MRKQGIRGSDWEYIARKYLQMKPQKNDPKKFITTRKISDIICYYGLPLEEIVTYERLSRMSLVGPSLWDCELEGRGKRTRKGDEDTCVGLDTRCDFSRPNIIKEGNVLPQDGTQVELAYTLGHFLAYSTNHQHA